MSYYEKLKQDKEALDDFIHAVSMIPIPNVTTKEACELINELKSSVEDILCVRYSLDSMIESYIEDAMSRRNDCPDSQEHTAMRENGEI
jgi:hypothetical protein